MRVSCLNLCDYTGMKYGIEKCSTLVMKKGKILKLLSHHNKVKVLLREKCPNTVFSGPHFPAFGLNTEIYSVNLCIQSKYRKIRTRKNSVFGHFSRSVYIHLRILDADNSLAKQMNKRSILKDYRNF